MLCSHWTQSRYTEAGETALLIEHSDISYIRLLAHKQGEFLRLGYFELVQVLPLLT